MLDSLIGLLSLGDTLRSWVARANSTMSAEERRELRKAFAALKFDEATLKQVVSENGQVRNYAAIRLRDSEKRVAVALARLSDFVEERHVALKLRDMADQVRYGKLRIRDEMREALMTGGRVELFDLIKKFNQLVDDLDYQLLGAAL